MLPKGAFSEREWDWFEERAAILQFEAGQTREGAEAQAIAEILAQRRVANRTSTGC